MLREQSRPTPEPPCAGCPVPCGRYDAWGHLLCAFCTRLWLDSAECEAGRLELYPVPAWQVARMPPEERPPLPTEAQTQAVYRRHIAAWLLLRRRVAA